MSLDRARMHLMQYGLEGRIQEFGQSSATVELAAKAVGCEPARIAKTLSFVTPAGPILILAEGTARVDNRKYKDTFFTKAKMIPFEEVEPLTGHAPGGVCPFGINDGVLVYLDESLRKFDVVYPAAGNGQSAVRLTVEELYEVSNAEGWVNVCKEN